MTLTPLTLLILIILAPSVAVSSIKGYKKGFYYASLKGLAVLFALFVAAMLSSNFISTALVESLWESLGIQLGEISEEIPAILVVAKALLGAIVSPIIFLPIFILIYILFKIIVAIILSAGKNKDDDGTSCSEENAPWFRKRSKPIGAFMGAVFGFIFAVIVVSPIVGTVMNTGQVLSAVENMQSLGTPGASTPEPASEDDEYDDELDSEEQSSSLGEDNEVIALIKSFSSDFGATVIYHMGGSFSYNLSARAEIDGVGFTLTKEVAALNGLFSSEGNMFAAFADMTSIDEDELSSLKETCDKLRSSYLLSYTMAGFMSATCTGWIDGESVMGMSPPELTPEIKPMLDSMLEVFSTSYADTVARDMTTLINVLEILNSSDIYSVGGDYNRLISILDDGSFIDSIVAELSKNPRMEPVMNNIHAIATQALVNQIKIPGYDEEEYHGIANDIAKELNGMTSLSDGEKVEKLTDKAVEIMGNQNIEVPESMAKLVIENLVKEIKPQNDTYSAKQIMEYLDQFQSNEAE